MIFRGHRFSALLLLFLGFPFMGLLWLGIYAISPGPASSPERMEVVIPAGSSLSAIEKILAGNNIIHDDARFALLAMLSGTAAKLRAGEYGFTKGVRPLDVIDSLAQGKVLYRSVTIPEGVVMTEVAGILAADGWVARERFLELACNPAFLAKYGIEAPNLEGYLFPDTYYLSRGQQGEADIIKMMLANHFREYEGIVKGMAADSPALSHHEIVTLASIVEKETGNPEERPLVASVYLNRLRKGMRLQADPTVRYGLDGQTGPLTREELKIPTPYNTYIKKGLPPGPIDNPGREAIKAVVFPARTEYLYFVRKDGTSHYFSRTLQEHNKAVKRYRNGQ